jgi:CRISPR/Cas system-associated exonuclease Cas4 (RecB family)
MSIKTIEEFRSASQEERDEAAKLITVEQDLYSYLRWLNSADGGQTEVRFKIGWNPHRAASLGFHPSQIAKLEACKLKLYFDVTGEVKPIPRDDTDMVMIFDLGTAMHSLLQTHFINMYGDQFEEEVWLKDERILINSTHTDGRFLFSNVRFLLEIKTIKEGGNYGWAKVQDRPFPDNIRQVMTYMYLDDCPFGLILYFCKNNSKIKEHVVMWDDDVWDEVRNKTMQPVVDAIEAGKTPVPSPGYDCRRCDYLHGCKAGKDHNSGRRNTRRRAVATGNRGRYVRHRGA